MRPTDGPAPGMSVALPRILELLLIMSELTAGHALEIRKAELPHDGDDHRQRPVHGTTGCDRARDRPADHGEAFRGLALAYEHRADILSVEPCGSHSRERQP